MFKELKLQSLVAGQSNISPLEHTMSILFIGFQNVALELNESSIDDEIKKWKYVREFAAKPKLMKGWQDSITSLIQTLKKRFSGLCLRDKVSMYECVNCYKKKL